MTEHTLLTRHAGEVRRALSNQKYELTDAGGIYLPAAQAFVTGAMRVREWRGGRLVGTAIEPNLIVNEGLNHLLNAALPPQGGYTPITAWYVALFRGNYTPDGNLTAATFASTANEFTDYTSAQRVPLVIASAAVAQVTGNSGNEAIFTLNAGGPYNIYGGAILSASAKGATTGKLLAAVRFSNPRLNMAGNDKLGIEYVLTAADAGA